MKSVLRIGALSGLAGGLAMAVVLATVGRGPIRDALALEEAASLGHGSAAHEEMFSRGVQEIGGALGLLLYGVALGIIFAIVLTAVSGYLPARSSLGATLQLGAIGFVTIVVVPFLKYPGNPPAVGDPDTINQRTLQYFAVLAASLALTALVLTVGRRARTGTVARAWTLAAIYTAGLLVIFVGLPANPDAVDAPAQLIWRFRLVSLAGLAAGWSVMSLTAGTLFTSLAHRDDTVLDTQPAIAR